MTFLFNNIKSRPVLLISLYISFTVSFLPATVLLIRSAISLRHFITTIINAVVVVVVAVVVVIIVVVVAVIAVVFDVVIFIVVVVVISVVVTAVFICVVVFVVKCKRRILNFVGDEV